MPNIRFTPPPFIGSKLALYFLTVLTAATLLLFILLPNSNNASAQQPATATSTSALTFKSISAGWNYTCGLLTNGAAVCWPDVDVDRKPPTGTFTSISTGDAHACGLRTKRRCGVLG